MVQLIVVVVTNAYPMLLIANLMNFQTVKSNDFILRRIKSGRENYKY